MKKALVLLLALSMVFGVFAAEPVANVNVSEFKGEAAVQWGVDLDSGKTGFKNEAKVTLKLNLLDGGDKASTGEGIWGEIKIKTDGDTFMKAEGQDAAIGTLPTKVKVDAAKLHFGDNAYIGIMSGDTLVGEYKLDTAVAAEQITNGNTGANTEITDGKITKQYSAGIVAGYGNDIFSVDVDFRSSDEAQYSNAYSFAVDGALKAVDNLTLKAGYSKDFANPYDETVNDAFYVATDYKLGLNDTFYIKPQVGYAHAITNDNAEKATVTNKGNLVAALLFGWGDKADDKPGVYFLDKDEDGKNSKKVTPGISVAMSKQLVGNQKKDGEIVYKGVESPMSLAVSFFSGKIVDNLTAAAYFATDIGKTTVEDKDGNKIDNMSDKEKAEGYEFAAGLKYKLTAGEGSITPQFGIAMANKGYATKTGVINYSNTKYNGDNAKDDAKDVLNIKAGAEFKGYVENTAFSVTYQSKNLKNTEEKDNKGTLNFKVKISL